MPEFVGRHNELAALASLFDQVRAGGSRPGKALLMRGRRRIGKSRLVEQFIDTTQAPALFFTASMTSVQDELNLFAAEAARSTLPGAALFDGQHPSTWDAALRLVAAAVSDEVPSIVVIDELPYLTLNDPAFESTLQKVFDREFSRKPVLLIGVGSNVAMMEALNTYGRPFHQRATEMVIPPFSPAEVGDLLQLPAAQAFDAALVTGGLPLICQEWRPKESLTKFLTRVLANPTSAFIVSAERALAAEFPSRVQAQKVLEAIGTGERSFASITRLLDLPHMSVTRSLSTLSTSGLVAAERPLSTTPSKETRYRVTDPYLRFWLMFVQPFLDHIERGRADIALKRIEEGWTAWRGRAIEPLIRESLLRRPELLPTGTAVVGGYWTRSNDVEVDLIGADRGPIAKKLTVIGSVKWLEKRPFDQHDYRELVTASNRIPGADANPPLLVVSRSGSTVDHLPVLGPDDLLAAWR